MKYCVNCGAKLASGAKFCIKCGVSLTQNTTRQVEKNSGDKQLTAESDNNTHKKVEYTTQTTNNDSSQNIENYFKDYWVYFVQTLKKPAQSLNMRHNSNGWLQLIFVILSFVLALATFLNSAHEQFLFGFDYARVINNTIGYVLVISVITQLVWFLGSYFIWAYLGKVNVNISDFLTQFGGFYSLNIIANLLICLVFLTGVGETSSIIGLIIVMLTFMNSYASFIYYGYQKAIKPIMNRIYLTSFALVMLIFVQVIVVMIFID